MSGVEQTYLANLREGRWLLPKCEGCGRFVFYPRAVCPHCGGEAFEWQPASGRGVIYSTTVMRRGKDGGDQHLCLVDLEEGVRMMSRVEGVGPGVPNIGDAVHGFVKPELESALVVFQLEAAR